MFRCFFLVRIHVLQRSPDPWSHRKWVIHESAGHPGLHFLRIGQSTLFPGITVHPVNWSTIWSCNIEYRFLRLGKRSLQHIRGADRCHRAGAYLFERLISDNFTTSALRAQIDLGKFLNMLQQQKEGKEEGGGGRELYVRRRGGGGGEEGEGESPSIPLPLRRAAQVHYQANLL